ncbi:two-component system sensor histidine kinase NtrB [Solilutibacter silvestris]|uniref:histidine kinase n=1 Tax=Solilutibacter silvestris TaxID=1645665 RepID=A0A2K1Q0V3_9GAMM|nr:ATP-binding protein [Lysobacter silvestris]PNS08678.1 Signal transduction histidine kinase nitrogen specific [Lysobacter silvestris]
MNESAPTTEPSSTLLTTPLAWTDGGGRIAGCNPAFARWLGVGARRPLGLPLVSLEAGGDVLSSALNEEGEEGAPRRLRRVPMQVPGVGEPRFADLWLSPLAGGWLLEVHPVDEFAQRDGDALPAAVAAALKGLAHELRNPLAGIKGAAQLIARRGDAGTQELSQIIQSEVERLTALLERLMSPRPQQPHAAVNVHAVLERVLRLAESDAGWAVRIGRDYDPSLPELLGDEDRLSQAAWNLVRNAIEAGANNITLRTRAEHGARIGAEQVALALRFDIVDDGPGVPPELAEQVFLPLVSGRADGSGLGLALAQQVAREHRGTVSYRSRPGHTVFTLMLPVQEETDDAA